MELLLYIKICSTGCINMFIYQRSNARSITKHLQFQLLTNAEYLQQNTCPYTSSLFIYPYPPVSRSAEVYI